MQHPCNLGVEKVKKAGRGAPKVYQLGWPPAYQQMRSSKLVANLENHFLQLRTMNRNALDIRLYLQGCGSDQLANLCHLSAGLQ